MAEIQDLQEAIRRKDVALVMAAIPLEALRLCGQGPLSDEVWESIIKATDLIRSNLREGTSYRESLKLSVLARELCLKFSFGEKSVIFSSPPHEVLKNNQNAFDELIYAGIVVPVPSRVEGGIAYRGTTESARIALEIMRSTVQDSGHA